MNDPLANLLARSFGSELPGAVQPRLSSRFEPMTTPGVESMPVAPPGAGNAPVAPTAGDPPLVMPESEHSPELALLSSYPHRAESQRAANAAATHTPLPEQVGERQRGELPAKAGVPPAEWGQPPTALPPAVPDPIPSVESPAMPFVLTPHKPAAAPITPQEATASHPSQEPIIAPVTPRDIAPSAGAPREPAVAPDVSRPAAPSSILPQEISPMGSREPTAHTRPLRITVTIGRVEVRATAPPPVPTPRPRAQPPTPALSLDEYLRRRDGGKR